jgi:hypothetical protein
MVSHPDTRAEKTPAKPQTRLQPSDITGDLSGLVKNQKGQAKSAQLRAVSDAAGDDPADPGDEVLTIDGSKSVAEIQTQIQDAIDTGVSRGVKRLTIEGSKDNADATLQLSNFTDEAEIEIFLGITWSGAPADPNDPLIQLNGHWDVLDGAFERTNNGTVMLATGDIMLGTSVSAAKTSAEPVLMVTGDTRGGSRADIFLTVGAQLLGVSQGNPSGCSLKAAGTTGIDVTIGAAPAPNDGSIPDDDAMVASQYGHAVCSTNSEASFAVVAFGSVISAYGDAMNLTKAVGLTVGEYGEVAGIYGNAVIAPDSDVTVQGAGTVLSMSGQAIEANNILIGETGSVVGIGDSLYPGERLGAVKPILNVEPGLLGNARVLAWDKPGNADEKNPAKYWEGESVDDPETSGLRVWGGPEVKDELTASWQPADDAVWDYGAEVLWGSKDPQIGKTTLWLPDAWAFPKVIQDLADGTVANVAARIQEVLDNAPAGALTVHGSRGSADQTLKLNIPKDKSLTLTMTWTAGQNIQDDVLIELTGEGPVSITDDEHGGSGLYAYDDMTTLKSSLPKLSITSSAAEGERAELIGGKVIDAPDTVVDIQGAGLYAEPGPVANVKNLRMSKSAFAVSDGTKLVDPKPGVGAFVYQPTIEDDSLVATVDRPADGSLLKVERYTDQKIALFTGEQKAVRALKANAQQSQSVAAAANVASAYWDLPANPSQYPDNVGVAYYTYGANKGSFVSEHVDVYTLNPNPDPKPKPDPANPAGPGNKPGLGKTGAAGPSNGGAYGALIALGAAAAAGIGFLIRRRIVN